jgi:hypothetical protein
VDERTDVYGLGAVLHFLLEGRPPSVVAGPAPRRTGDRAALHSIAAKAMAREPAARYATVQELMADLSRYTEGAPVLAHPEGFLRRAGRMLVKYPVAVTLVVAYLVMRAVLLLFAG